MIGQIIFLAQQAGSSITVNGKVYALCNGQTLSRSTYSSLSSVWPSGAFGSDDVNVKLPNLNNHYLRGSDFNRGADPSVASRTALAGNIPVTSGIGSYQAHAMTTHSHPNGTTQFGLQRTDGGAVQSSSTSISATTSGATTATSGVIVSGTFEPASHIMYPYIQIT